MIDLIHDSPPRQPAPRRWFWSIIGLLLLNAVLAFGYYVLDWNPASTLAVDEPALTIAPQAIRLAPAVPVAPPSSCLVWGAFNTTQADELNAKAQSAGLPAALSQPVTVTASHIIAMGPYPNRAAVDKKMGELKRLKVSDFAAADKLTISLGVFSSQDAAQERLKALGKQGVRSAKIIRKDTVIYKVALRFESLLAPQAVQLKALATDLGVLSPC
jgi:hypothetical protein